MVANKYALHRKDINFVNKFVAAQNTATGSEVDSNSNVSGKNIATMAPEVHKKENIKINRLMMHDKLTEMYDEEIADKYIEQLEKHEIYTHDESTFPFAGVPYCASITLYPYLFDGMTKLSGTTIAPKNLDSFCGGFINLVFAVAAQLKGAVATPEFLAYMDYFLRLQYGNDYYLHADRVVDMSNRQATIDTVITDHFQQVVYSINQPAAARGSQSVFWNIAYFDKYYFNALFEDFVFPDGTPMQWESVSWLQKRFMKWFNKERLKEILTFPVESLSLLNDGKDYCDQEWYEFAAEMYAEGHSFFTYTSDSVDSLASCCRLRNGITENQFSYTLGAGGISTGSKCVITMNLNRLVQNRMCELMDCKPGEEDIGEVRSESNAEHNLKDISDAVSEQTRLIHMYLSAYNEILLDMTRKHMISIYDAGFISPEKEYLTVGINGAVEGAEYLGIDISNNDKYKAYINAILKPIYLMNKLHKTDTEMFNTEFVPAENLGVKNAKWDKEDGYQVPRPCYNSYFYIVEDEKTNPIDKFQMHGKDFTQYLDGGSALHCNLDEHLSKEQYKFLLKYAIVTGCNYFTFNIPNTICNECGHISKHRLEKCPKCGSDNLDYATRVIGYLTRVSKWSADRQAEHARRFYAPSNCV